MRHHKYVDRCKWGKDSTFTFLSLPTACIPQNIYGDIMKRTNRKIIIGLHGDIHTFSFRNVPDFVPDKMLYQMISEDFEGGYAK